MTLAGILLASLYGMLMMIKKKIYTPSPFPQHTGLNWQGFGWEGAALCETRPGTALGRHKDRPGVEWRNKRDTGHDTWARAGAKSCPSRSRKPPQALTVIFWVSRAVRGWETRMELERCPQGRWGVLSVCICFHHHWKYTKLIAFP